jgi:ubiquinone biosynthesis protein
MGLTYVKLGQFLAMRFDVVPPDVARELGRLFEDVAPLRTDVIHTLVEAELGAPIEELFACFRPSPVAAASVAQVHEAWTVDGRHVAVKVQRPGIERIFASDIRNLRRLARLADRLGLLGALSALEIVDEFSRWTAREFDFVTEAMTAERLRASALPYEHAPTIEWALTTRRVLTMQFLEGISLATLGGILDDGGFEELQRRLPWLDLPVLVHRVATACLRQIFVKGFFHGDPHPGNILVQEDNTVAFVDFGIFGELTDYHREQLAAMIESVALGDVDRSFRYYSALADPTADTDFASFEREGKAVLRRWYEAMHASDGAPGAKHLGRYAGEMTEVVRRHRLRLSPETLLFWRALHALDSTAVRIGERFDLLSELRGFFESIRPGFADRVKRDLFNERWIGSLAAFSKELPTRARLIQSATRGQFVLEVFAEESRRDRAVEARRTKALAAATTVASIAAAAAAIWVEARV